MESCSALQAGPKVFCHSQQVRPSSQLLHRATGIPLGWALSPPVCSLSPNLSPAAQCPNPGAGEGSQELSPACCQRQDKSGSTCVLSFGEAVPALSHLVCAQLLPRLCRGKGSLPLQNHLGGSREGQKQILNLPHFQIPVTCSYASLLGRAALVPGISSTKGAGRCNPVISCSL